MLVQKSKFNEQDVVAVKLISGEEIVAKIVEIDGDTVVVSKPISLMVGQDATGRLVTAMSPFMVGADDDMRVRLDPSKFLAMGRARRDLQGEYLKSTTGLAMAPPNIDLGNGQLR